MGNTLAGIWLSTFWSIFWRGNAYYGIPRWRAKRAWFVAKVITETCAAIRRERRLR